MWKFWIEWTIGAVLACVVFFTAIVILALIA